MNSQANKTTIALSGLSIGYRSHHGVSTVATGITATISSGELTCLLGENGAGKSTLLRTLSRFQPRLGGSMMLCGREIDSYSDQELARQVSVVLTERIDVQLMKASELVAMGRSPYTGYWGRLSADDHRIVNDAIHMVGIDALADRLVTTLSDGERQKVMIAKALAQQTPVIFLDEPTAFLDYPSKVEMLLLLRRISHEADKTVFLSTHDLELALQVADRVWLMRRNGAISIGTPRQLADNGTLHGFINRDGIVFCPDDFSVKVTIKE